MFLKEDRNDMGTVLERGYVKSLPYTSISQQTFERAKRAGNTHYCFICGGIGFRPEKSRFFRIADLGKPTNQLEDEGRNPMFGHNASHIPAVVGNLMRYQYAGELVEWETKRKRGFPFVVTVQYY